MTLTAAKLRRAKAVLERARPADEIFLVHRGRVLVREQDASIIEQLLLWLAIDGWRDRFGDPANNPFR